MGAKPLRARLTVPPFDPLHGVLLTAYRDGGTVALFERQFKVTKWGYISAYPADVSRFDLIEIVLAR